MKKIHFVLLVSSLFIIVSDGKYYRDIVASNNPIKLKSEQAKSTLDKRSFLPIVMNNFASGFDDDFYVSAAGWFPHPEFWKWKLVDGEYYSTTGIPGAWVSTSYTTRYSNFDYQAALRRNGCTGCPHGLIVRGQHTPAGDGNRWNSGYGFYISLSGYYGVFKYSNGIITALQEWNTSENINRGENDWNILRVRSDGEEFEFIINDNDSPVWTGQNQSLIAARMASLCTANRTALAIGCGSIGRNFLQLK